MLFAVVVAVFGLVPQATDLKATGDKARADTTPIVLYVSRSDCTFCRAFERDVFAPLIKSQTFTGRVQFVELVMDGSSALVDFSGKVVSPRTFADQYDVHVTPTLMFLDANGNEVLRRKVGYSGNEFFSYYFERAIEDAINAVSAETANNASPRKSQT